MSLFKKKKSSTSPAKVVNAIKDKFRTLTKKEPAASPRQLSSLSWREAIKQVLGSFKQKKLSTLAASVAYYGVQAFFPAVAAAVAIAGFVINPSQLLEIAEAMAAYLPRDIANLFITQLEGAAAGNGSNIAVAAVAIGLSIFSVSGAVQSLVQALNVAYDVEETRNPIQLRLRSMLLTACGLLAVLIIVPILFSGDGILRWIGLNETAIAVFNILRWPLLVVAVSIALALFYRFGPNREAPKWQWVSWGASIATILWLIVSALFFIYLQHFANLSDSYSLFAGIIALMIWLNLSSVAALLGAEINRQLEYKTLLPTKKSK
ncbi:YihY/virulence factor BrkB family protein [Candidatus Saccharibacteria bacterium]|nr:YihY/virulence factor BrkB family protein [Candidatus Saccharibacteria bacterium]